MQRQILSNQASQRTRELEAMARDEEQRVVSLWTREYEFRGMSPLEAYTAARAKFETMKREALREQRRQEKARAKAQDALAEASLVARAEYLENLSKPRRFLVLHTRLVISPSVMTLLAAILVAIYAKGGFRAFGIGVAGGWG
jgi:hypothetical protein